MNTLPLIEKIHLLESKLGLNHNYILMEPFKFDSANYIELQKAARKIADHIGLHAIKFIISYSSLNEKVGGQIHLDNKHESFITIADNIKDNCEIVLSILAHEICHKYLHNFNLKCFPEFENEMLTDAATIFTGLGKLSLNGCENKIDSFSSFTYSGNKQTKKTTFHKVGYMDREQFAFVYKLVSEMNYKSEIEILKGLTPESTTAVKGVSHTYQGFFNKKYFKNDDINNKISEFMDNELKESKKKYAAFFKDTRIIKESILVNASRLNDEYHFFIKEKFEKLFSNANSVYNKEAHNYVKNLLASEELEIIKLKLIDKNNKITKLGFTFSKFARFVINILSENNFEFLGICQCPSCGKKAKVPRKKLITVNCSNCKYNFMVDTGYELVEKTETGMSYNIKKLNNEKKEGFIDRIKSLFHN